eukprot:GGOE01020048.1.p1 GENE.GGOE01020048.1~~GGOE01020048.1.p1  ORF type:complete len:1603 (+),score=697.34 GGOE01020048.1:27-4811(+)
MAEIFFRCCLGYGGTAVWTLPEDEICFTTACGVQFYNLKTGKHSFLWGPRQRPVTHFTVSPRRDMFAFSDRARNPTVYIYSYPQKERLHQLQNVAEYEVAALAFDRSGTHLGILNGLPDYKLQVWSMEGRDTRLVADSGPTNTYARFVSFNPLNPRELCTSGSGAITFWKVEKQQALNVLVATEAKGVSGSSVLHCHTWAPGGEVYAGCEDGELYRFTPSTGVGELLPETAGTQPVRALAISKHHLIVACEDGTLRFLSHMTKSCERAIELGAAQVSSCQFETDWHSLVVGCGDGKIVRLDLPGYDTMHLAEEDFRAIAPEVALLADFHGGAVVACAHLMTSKCLATVGADGTLRIWDYSKTTLKSKISVGLQPSCLAVGECAGTHSILAIGSATGTLTLVHADDVALPLVLWRGRLDMAEILSVKFHPESAVVCVALANNKVFWVDAAERQVLGWTHAVDDGKICDLCWVGDTPDVPSVLVSVNNGDLFAFTLPTAVDPAVQPTFEVKREDVLQNVWRLDYAALRLTYSRNFSEHHQVFTLAEDKTLKVVLLTKDRQLDLKDEPIPLCRTVVSYADFSKPGSVIQLSPEKSTLLACGTDGKCVVRDVQRAMVEEPPKGIESIASRAFMRHSPFGTGITGAAWGNDNRMVFTVGADGFVFCLRLRGPAKEHSFYTSEAPQEIEIVPEEEDLFTVKLRKQEEAFIYMTNESYRAEVKAKVAQLARRLAALKKANEMAEEMEKLGPQEFMVESMKEEARIEGDAKVATVREEIRWQNVARDYLVDKIKRECYDAMEVKINVLRGMVADVEVPNYNVRFKAKADAKLLRKVKFLRRVQKEEFRRRKGPSFVDQIYAEEEEEGEDLSSPASPVKAEDKPEEADKKEEKGKKPAESGEAKKPPTEEVLADDSVTDLLYVPFEEYTRHRAITQMWLLNGQINYTKKQFNDQHIAMLTRKRADISKIAEKNVRIQQILHELDHSEPIFQPKLVNSEQPEKLLEVLDSEITVEKYHSPEELQRLEAARLEDARRRAEQEDDSVEKGLKLMMDGKLERDENVVQVIKRPEFMDTKPQEEWTDEDLKAIKDYEQKLKKKEEEEEKKRKQLEAELKNIKKETQEVAQGFDAALQGLMNQKLETDQAIYELELRIIKLAQYVMHREDLLVKVVKLGSLSEEIKSKTARSNQRVIDYKRELDAKVELHQQFAAEERNADKKFRQYFAEADEYVDVLLKLLKRRGKTLKGKGKAQDTDDTQREDLGSIDPFATVDPRSKLHTADSEMRLDKPEGLPEGIWQEFLAYRQQRFETDREMKELGQEVQDMQREFQRIKAENEELQTKMEHNLRRLNDFQANMERDAYNLDYLQEYKQGQIEVEQAAVVTDYADAVLIHKSRIESLNDKIRASGGEKVKILREMKDFKKGIHAVEWETEMLDYTIGTLEVEYRHLHTLRVTKAMQEFIKGGGEGHNETERAKLFKKLEHVKHTYEQKVEEKKKAIAKVKKLAKEKASENLSLGSTAAEASQLVQDRDEIVSLQSTGVDQARAAKMMKDLRTTRKLEEVAKAQQDELAELRQRIDRLRERTFPSFAVVSKRVIGNPDEKESPL